MYQKNANQIGKPNELCHKIMLIMRLTTVILFASLFQLSAASLAQKVTISKSNAELKTVLKDLKEQSGFVFLYSDDVLKQANPVTIKVNNKDFQLVLDEIFAKQPLSYDVSKNIITIKEKKKSFIDKIIDNIDAIDIRGTVFDEFGKPMPGTSVRVKSTNKIVKTNSVGEFTLPEVNVGDVLVFSFIGYETTEITFSTSLFSVNGGLVITLKPQTGTLNEVNVVNTGYQKISKMKTTGSVVTLDSKELEKRNAVNILDNLEGTVPGLVRYRGNTTIRGTGTIRANSGVLVVVDGLPIDGSIEDVNPYDVESISVLKDAAAASIYGARASNGVIVVTTKRAKEVGRTSVDFSVNLTTTNKPDYSYQNFMSAAQQVDWESNYQKWYFGGAGGTVPDPVGTFETNLNMGLDITPIAYAYYRYTKSPASFSQAQLDAELNGLKQNDFLKEFHNYALRRQLVQQYNLAVRTNNGKSQTSLVVNYTTDNAGIINAFDRRLNLNFKGSYSIAKWMDVEYGVNGVIGKARSHSNTFATNPFNVPSYYKLLNADGSRAYYSTSQFNQYLTYTETSPKLFSAKFNHLDELGRDYRNTSTLNTRYYVNLNFKPLPGLTINPMFQYEDNRSDYSAYAEPDSYRVRMVQNVYTMRAGTAPNYTYTNLLPKGGLLNTGLNKSPGYTARAQANYTKEFNKHGIIALGGVELRQTRAFGNRGILLGYDDQLQSQTTNNVNFLELYNKNTTFWNPNYPTVRQFYFPTISDIGLDPDILHRYASSYANITYTYDRKYNVFGSIRKDFADLFGASDEYRGKPLWSIGGSWNASNEEFMKDLTFVNQLKVRASYGFTGNIDLNTSALLSASTGNGVNSDTQLPSASVSNPPNPYLRWEKTETTNIGIDFNLFNDRLRGALDWYQRKGTDLFATKRLDPSEGFTSMVINNASMVNKGIDLNLGYEWFRPTAPQGLSWFSNLVLSVNKNKITYVDEVTTNSFALIEGDNPGPNGGYRVGDPVRALYSFRFAGLDNTGLPTWYTAAGDRSTALLNSVNDVVFSGTPDPKVNISLNNDVAFKGFSLSVFATYYGGHHFRARQAPAAYNYAPYNPLPIFLLDSWTPTNTDTDIPGSGQYYQQSNGGSSGQWAFSDILIRRADFIKIRNIVLGYDLPAGVASKIKASNLKFRFQINNPKSVWTRQTDVHVDPETGGAPIPTSFVFGINANF